MIFELLTKKQILQEIVDHIRAGTGRVLDLSPHSDILHYASAVARSIEKAYIEIARLLELFSIDRCKGADLDARARDYLPDGEERQPATYATGTLCWTTAIGAPSEVPIPVGTLAAGPGGTYVTITPGRIAAGATQSERTDGPGDILGRAVLRGAAGNTAAATVTRQVTVVPFARAVTNPTRFAGGFDAESDDALRARIRDRVRSLSRCTVIALETRAREAEAGERRVTVARCWEDPVNRGRVLLYVDDGTGQAESYATTLEVEDLVTSATGGEVRLWTRYRPLRGGAWVVTLHRAGVATVLVPGVDYALVQPWGLVEVLAATFPTGLLAGDRVTISPYRYFTGLVAAAQLGIDGADDDPTTYPAWRAAGVVVQTLTPTVRWQVIDATIAVLDGYSRDAVIAQVTVALTDYVNSRNIGDDLILAEMVERAMAVEGMYDIRFATPVQNVPVGDHELARIQASNVTVR